MLVMMRRDYGPMLKAERRAITTGQVSAGSADGNSDEADELKKLDPKDGVKLRWYNAFFPVLVTIGVTFIGLLVTGYDFSLWDESPDIQQKITDADTAGFFGMIFKSIGLIFTPGFLSGIIGNSDSYVALLWGSMMGVLTAMIFSVATKTMKLNETISTLMVGIKTMLPAIIILILAWSLAAITDQLHTGDYLTSVFSGNLNPNLLPLLTFVFAGFIAFSTGSSWSTMAILYPILLPLTWQLSIEAGLTTEQLMPIFYNVTASVLAGAVLGDHCSPISDTTVLSSLATSCNHIDHVRTQLPYALTVGGISVFVGGILFMVGLPFIVNLLIGVGMMYVVIRFAGKRAEQTEVL